MLNIFFLTKTILRIIYYLLFNYKRYANILIEIILLKPKIILEIGVYKGQRAQEIIEAARIFNKKILYYGFDLFEDFFQKKNILNSELSKKPELKKNVYKKICKLAKVELFKGYTKKTIPTFLRKKIKPDFIFLDGGHSVKTIKQDWNNIKKCMYKNSVCIFDDYYTGSNELIKKYGCNQIIKNLKHYYHYKILFFSDFFLLKEKSIKINMVKVKLNKLK